ncbi:leishmanolysin-related zinc metalloendopeptidase [Marivirga arenosa]|uniref:Leishmanolysin-related zinc metalloendopeptidase n=1 Tax=Marivirga arenosa TaxID=3059076 RepID=A0AA52EZ31_9BACT|nr:leishmanolysin-related zinc metalloendopeptidase [Marivirga sp. BKB1-2]WNB18172.1 leishmanolysin-related zinc metalloendopeptidase [Marivirga sp. BKB1-2]
MKKYHKAGVKPSRSLQSIQMFSFSLVAFALFFTSCSQESEFNTDQPIEQKTKIELAQSDQWIEIQAEPSSSLRTTEAAGVDRGRFNITLKYVVPVTERQEQVFEAAAARWERIIIKDVPSFTGVLPSAFGGFPPAVDGTVDDIIIEVALAPIDGPGRILGQAGPRFVRTIDNLTLSGVMFFDVDDLSFLDEIDLFEEVIVHEMGHVLGVGTLWNFNRSLLADADTNPYFTGKKANVHWNAEGGDGELPIENMGGPGTALGHWRESVLNNELMTGFLNLGENPLSRITAASMKDLGYGAAVVGDQYDLPKGAPGVDVQGGASTAEGLDIAAMEVTLLPIGSVTTN